MSKPSSARYRTTNWSSYNASLRKRGSLLIWVDREMTWLAPRDGRPGRPPIFSDAAIQFCLSIKVLFKLPLRQTAGMVASLLRMAGLDWPVPDFATLWKGAKNSNYQVSIQHKITDRRNGAKNTWHVLPDHERRARIEVTISGSETLRNRGLSAVNDLASVSFRKLTTPFLSFRLGTVEPWQHLLEDAQAQTRTRGVYGIELRDRAHALEEREELRRSGKNLPRKMDHEGQGLQSWPEMNDVIGDALDQLRGPWSVFSWR